ncbi:MAG: class B sortase [Oscillospiraceae bacterium]|jgi:sortase B|nr:class B sortase [Oscillospiraceae bacterium]
MAKDKGHYPESEDTLNALEGVLKASGTTAKKKNFFAENFIPRKTDSKRERRRKALLSFCALVMFLCLLVLLWFFVIDPGMAKKTTGDINDAYGSSQETVTNIDGDALSTTRSQEQRRLSYSKLQAMNPEYIGWLSAPGGKIDLPIVKTTNNNYYLHRDFKCNPSRYGNPFLDQNNSVDPLDANLIIYGHHMKDGKIFAHLQDYQQKETVLKHPVISLELKETTLQYKIFAVFRTNGYASEDNGYVFQFNTTNFTGKADFDGFIRQLKQRTLINTGVDVAYGDRLISLQTCMYDYSNEFLVVVGRLVRSGESTQLDPGKVTRNSNPRYAQAYYDKREYNNPFKNAERWFPGKPE